MNYALRHDGVWGSECIDSYFLDSVLAGGEWSASYPSRFTPGTVGNSYATELLESAATLTREMKSYDKVTSLRGANTLLQGQQINGQSTQKADQQADKSSRPKETNTDQRRPDPRRSKDQSRRTRTALRHNVRGSEHIVKETVLTTREVVNKPE
jgi:hypothetical protein